MKRVVVGLWLCLAAAVGAADDVDKAPASDASSAASPAASPAVSPAASPVVRAAGAVSALAVTVAVAAPAPAAAVTVASTTPTSGPHFASIAQSAGEGGDKGAAGDGGPAAARFETAAQWKIAGYNNEEIIYTIVVTSHDSRIIRCNTELKGSYYENGQKLSVADRQLSTVFPDQQVQVGNWMGMDEKSGATYSVKCHAI